jgi:rhamnosyltransferase
MKNKILVLMATYNGKLFLDKQLESIFNQRDYKPECWVQDDGSDDGTLEILEKWKEVGLVSRVSQSQHGVPGHVFIDLINAAPRDCYIFLSDQDDIWHQDKIKDSLKAFENSGALLVCSDRDILRSNGKVKRIKRDFDFSWGNALIQNCVFGNTVCISPKGIETLQSQRIPYLVYHDAFLYLHFSNSSAISQLRIPRTEYRIHSQQAVGLPPAKFARVKADIIMYSKFIDQYMEVYGSEILPQNLEVYTKLKSAQHKKSMLKSIFAVLTAPVNRQNKIETIMWKLIYCFTYSTKSHEFI